MMGPAYRTSQETFQGTERDYELMQIIFRDSNKKSLPRMSYAWTMNKDRNSFGTLTASICSLDNIGMVLLIEGLMLLSIHAPMAPDPIWCIRSA